VVVVTGSSDLETAERCESLGLFYGRKGPEFWKNIEAALTEIYPNIAGRIVEQELQTSGAEVHEHPRVLVVDDDPASMNSSQADMASLVSTRCLRPMPCMDFELRARSSRVSS
jgi:hypothetical protein